MCKKLTSVFVVIITVFAGNGRAVQYVPEATNRETINFNIGWRFHKGDIAGAENPAFDDSGWQLAHVPHTMEWVTYHFPSDYQSFYRGIGWYRKHFTVGSEYSGRRIYIHFEGAMTVTDVWVNGTYMGKHYGGYTRFTFDITDSVTLGGGDNVIAVKVDNTYQEQVPPEGISTSKPDYALFGGLYRDVYLVFTDELHIQDPVYAGDNGGGIFVTYPSVSSGSATVNVETWVYNASATSKDCNLITTIVDASNEIVATMQSSSLIDANTTQEFDQNTVVSDPNLWSPSNPYLYTVCTTVREGLTAVDDYQTRIGIRSILFDHDTGFFINGQPLELIGACRHQTWPFIGSAVPNSAHVRDMQMMKDGGMNFVRLSHYVQDPAVYATADELGLLLWDEVPGWQGPSSEPVWRGRCYQSMRDMVRGNRNHPSIIIWAGVNEAGKDDDLETNLNNIAKSLDTTRYTSQARNYNTSNNIYDIYGRNYGHSSNPDSSTLGFVESEYSGWQNPCHRYDSDTQNVSFAETYEDDVEAHRDLAWCAGGVGWCMFDYQTPFTFQNKWEDGVAYHGLVDLFRIPKFVYYFYMSQRDANEPMVFIANYWTSSSPTNVKVYSNCEQVELFINDVSQGVQGPDSLNMLHPPFTFPVSYSAGTLRAEGLIGGEIVASHTVMTPGATAGLHLEADPATISADGSDLARIVISVVDSAGTVVRDASNIVDLSVTGPGVLIGGNPEVVPPVEVEGGMFAVLVQSTLTPGTVTVTATSSGLTSDSVDITSTGSMPEGIVEDIATSDIKVSGTATGLFADTWGSDNNYEAIEEIESPGSPHSRYSYVEHKWTTYVTGGDTVTFYVEAYHSANAEGDDFVFAYSMDDSNYTDVLTVTKTTDDDTYQSYELPNDINGTVYIRVKDTDHTAGNKTLDTIYIDHIYVRSEPAGLDADFNGDDKVNFIDYAELADAWQSSLGQPAFNEIYDLHDDDIIDIMDLDIFAEKWLWEM